MKFEYLCQLEEPTQIKYFFHHLDLPRGFTTAVKFGGAILLNGNPVTVRATIQKGDTLTLVAPDEKGHDTVLPSFEPIEIVYEDRDVLVVNKPADVVSIPSIKDPDSAMANRIKGYYVQQQYADQVIHIVTRLDRDTTGLMLIAKHRLAHAYFDRQIKNREIKKIYYAISSQAQWEPHGLIDAPIARSEASLITRQVHESGKQALTEYWLHQSLCDSALLKLQLHTGRTHQIRVHLTYQGGPLVGDDLYGGPLTPILSRQALHCGELQFLHPFTRQWIELNSPLPQDMQQWVDEHGLTN
ncbi:RluA family pseudouridine synthase [Aerococcaceae bacterium zg-ZUI334]|uniref:RluA family pseudouridine synthase n=1 Tax=Aerococcaceae bacterium zg-252 TaxID=2796928 RepID=UPI001B94E860|nr:RluA family pseudouridine synthase [Aerococcaceae bacterium zg-ZUI334]